MSKKFFKYLAEKAKGKEKEVLVAIGWGDTNHAVDILTNYSRNLKIEEIAKVSKIIKVPAREIAAMQADCSLEELGHVDDALPPESKAKTKPPVEREERASTSPGPGSRLEREPRGGIAVARKFD